VFNGTFYTTLIYVYNAFMIITFDVILINNPTAQATLLETISTTTFDTRKLPRVSNFHTS